LRERVGVLDSAAVVGANERDALLGELLLVHAAELVLRFLILDTVEDEAALGVVKEAEGVASLGDGDNVHETCGETFVGADFAVNLDEALHADCVALSLGKGVLQAVTQDNDEGKGLAEFVRTSAGSRGPDTLHLAEHPVLRGMEPL
jgi:hypothetical protein